MNSMTHGISNRKIPSSFMSQLTSPDPGKYSRSHGPADVGSEDIFPEHIDSEVLTWLRKCITDFWNVVWIHMLPWLGLAHAIITIVHRQTLC